MLSPLLQDKPERLERAPMPPAIAMRDVDLSLGEGASRVNFIETRAGRIQNAPAYEGRSPLPRRIAVENIANR